MSTERPIDDARRLEALLITVRWLVAAFGAVQVGFAVRDSGADRPFALILGIALVVGLLVGNLLHRNSGINRHDGGGGGALAEDHEDGLHPDRTEGDVGGGHADGDHRLTKIRVGHPNHRRLDDFR